MEKRAFLAGGLSLLVFIVFQYFVIPKQQVPQVEQQISKSVQRDSTVNKSAEVDISGQEFSASEAPEIKIEEKSFVVDTGVASIKLNNKGGALKSISLLEYSNSKGEPINLLAREGIITYPVSIEYGDESLRRIINRAAYQVDQNLPESIKLSESLPEQKITFIFNDRVTGVTIEKSYTFYLNDFAFSLSVAIRDNNRLFAGFPARILWSSGISSDVVDTYAYNGPTVLENNKLTSDNPDDQNEEMLYSASTRWIAMQDKYFMAAIIPEQSGSFKGVVKNIGKDLSEIGFQFATDTGAKQNFKLFAGPKKSAILKKYNVSLERIIHFGWVDVIGKPLFSILQWLYGFTKNYGIAIILVTISIKVVFFPLTQKSFKSMKDLQKIQPYMKIIQERYKDDKNKLNQEMMKLYKDNKVNPLGGCLPTIVQIPVFIALYQVLLNTIELRNAPFFLWITDLSSKDPFYVTPLLMGASMFLQQKMTPTSISDPIQAKMMMYLPVVFTVMFLNFPSGLVLYWLVNNLLTIGQQYLINKPDKK